MKYLVTAICLLFLATPAWADNEPKDPAQIVLQLVEEDWVETDTARVVLQLKTLLTDGAEAEPVVDPKAMFAPVADADWQMTRFQRGQTDTGFEQWVIVAEARVPQSALTGIYDRVKAATSRGRSMSVVEIDFTPSLAERQATAAKLRAALYKRASAEAATIAKQFPDRGFQVQRVDFHDGGQPQPVMMRTQAASEGGYADRAKQMAGYSPAVAERLVLSATIVVASDD